MISLIKSVRFYLVLILLTDLGLLWPPLRFMASLILIGFLPGYFIVERLALWKNPLFATIGSLGISFLISPLIVLPGCFLFQQVNAWIIVLSLNSFLLGMICLLRGRERIHYPEKDHSPWLPLMMVFICLWIFIYLDITGLGPYCSDWTYLFGIVKELSRNMPPHDPEASILPLRYQWVFWFFYALLHRLSGLSVWKVLEWGSVYSSFIFMGVVYMLLYQATKNRVTGLWGILLFAIGRHSEWIIQGLFGHGWRPGYVTHMSYEYIQAITGYSLLWGWYTLPGLLPPLLSFFFLIRYLQENRKTDLWFSLGACSISPFFHPVYYFGFLGGFSILLIVLFVKKEFKPWLLLYYLTFLPFFLTFYLYFHPNLPEDPLYRFFFEKKALIKLFWFYIFFDGMAIPLGVLAVIVSPAARKWFLPFALLFAFLCLFGAGLVNHAAHLALQNSLYLTLLSAIGLGYLMKFNRWTRTAVYALVLFIIFPPYLHEISSRIQTGWEEIVQPEQMAAGYFIRAHTDPNSSFVILPESEYSIKTIEGVGERKLMMGLSWHLDRYESKASINKWDQEIKAFFLTANPQGQYDFLKKYKIDYIFLGPEELDYLKEHHIDMNSFKNSFTSVYKNPGIEILKQITGQTRN